MFAGSDPVSIGAAGRCDYQAGPEDESFAASGALRLGIAEMTRTLS
jgi:hypothetical protein